MPNGYLGEIRLMSFGFPPRGWKECNGQLLPVNQNQALYSLLGTTYGGDRRVNFALPDLRGRVPIHVGSGHPRGERGGEVNHALSIAELPHHAHVLSAASGLANSETPGGAVLARSLHPVYGTAATGGLVALSPNAVSRVGGSQAHVNMQPFCTLFFCICIQGAFPSPG